MTLSSDQDWADAEAKALAAEQREAESFLAVEPVPEPTISQQLLWATTRAAQLQARLIRLQGHARTAWMWLGLGDKQHAQEELSKIILGI